MKAKGPSRPQGGEDEDDLLKAQELFMKSADQSQPAASARRGAPPLVVKKTDTSTAAKPGSPDASVTTVGSAGESAPGTDAIAGEDSHQARRVQCMLPDLIGLPSVIDRLPSCCERRGSPEDATGLLCGITRVLAAKYCIRIGMCTCAQTHRD